MAVYFVACVSIKDQEKYDQYAAKGAGTLPASAKVLALDTKPGTVEGEWPYTETGILEFPDEATFRAWYESPAYQQALEFRLEGAESNCVLLHSLE